MELHSVVDTPLSLAPGGPRVIDPRRPQAYGGAMPPTDNATPEDRVPYDERAAAGTWQWCVQEPTGAVPAATNSLFIEPPPWNWPTSINAERLAALTAQVSREQTRAVDRWLEDCVFRFVPEAATLSDRNAAADLLRDRKVDYTFDPNTDTYVFRIDTVPVAWARLAVNLTTPTSNLPPGWKINPEWEALGSEADVHFLTHLAP